VNVDAVPGAQLLRGHRLGHRGWEILSAACADGLCIPEDSRSLDQARLRAARRLRRLGLLEHEVRSSARRVRPTELGYLIAEEVMERHRAGVDVRWPSVIASLVTRIERT
jgi:hypothetical protein